MSEYDMGIHSNPDAKAWASFYKSTFPEADEDLMHTWFANAMMAMHDYLQNNKIAELEQQLAEEREAHERLRTAAMAVTHHLQWYIEEDGVVEIDPEPLRKLAALAGGESD